MQVRFPDHPAVRHFSADELEEYAMGRAGEMLIESIEEHLLLCEECRGALDEVEQELRVLRIVLREAEISTPVQ